MRSNKSALLFSVVIILLSPKLFLISPVIYWFILRLIQSLPSKEQARSQLSVEMELPFFGQILAASPSQAWREWQDDPATCEWVGALIRAQERGRPIGHLLRVSAISLVEERSRRARMQVSKLGVKLSLPIGICFLPAFISGAIVPIVISFFSTLKFF